MDAAGKYERYIKKYMRNQLQENMADDQFESETIGILLYWKESKLGIKGVVVKRNVQGSLSGVTIAKEPLQSPFKLIPFNQL